MPAPTYSPVLQQLSTAVILCRFDGIVMEINTAAQSLLGISIRVGDNLFERLNKSGELYPVIERAKAKPQGFLIRELKLGRVSSQQPASLVFDCVVNSDIGIDENGKNLILLELHDRERYAQIREETELWEQQAITKKITRQLAHEIKNPLAGIRGAAQLLEKKINDEKQQAFTQLIINEVDRLALLSDNLLGPAKEPNKQLVNIHSILQHVLQLVSSADSQKRVSIERDFDPSLPDIAIDRNQIIQVLLNLTQNAIQAMLENKTAKADAKLKIKTRILSHYTIGKSRYKLALAIHLIDNGPGVSSDIEEHLFYPLVTSRAEGTGLGLSISQLLVQRHNGLIEYRRDNDQQLTHFTVLLPYD